jgi:hypothetical protein
VGFGERLSVHLSAGRDVMGFAYATNSVVGCEDKVVRGTLERGSEEGEMVVEVVRGYVPDP